MTTQLQQLQLLETKFAGHYDHRHLTQAADGVFMAAFREGVEIETLFGMIEGGEALDALFFQASKGNVFDFVAPELRGVAKRIFDLSVGGNGGQGSVGRGEFGICFLSNFFATPSKEGKGDLDIEGSVEEVKWNGGRVGINDDAGRLIWQRMQKLLADSDLKLKTADFVPCRKADKKLYDAAYLAKLNGLFWQAATGEINESLSDTELKALFVERSYQKVFSVSNSALISNNDGDFVRFTSVEQAVEYYSDKLDSVTIEYRTKQTNAASIYATL